MKPLNLIKYLVPLGGLFFILLILYFATLVIYPKQVQNQEVLAASKFTFGDLIPSPAPYPLFQNRFAFSPITAKSAIAIDMDSMVTLYEQEADLALLPASTTKLMTALVTLENYRLDQVLTFDGLPVEGNVIGLKAGEQMTVRNLLYGALVGSGNDSAYTLAVNYPGGLASFVNRMNTKAIEIHLQNSHFTNPVGWDEEGHFSTARDLATLAIAVLKQPVITEIVATPKVIITDITGTIIHTIKNTNELVNEEGFKGVKTGWTENAGECLIGLYKKDNRQIVTVVLKSGNRIGETKQLTGWVMNNYNWEIINPRINYQQSLGRMP